MFKKRLKEIRQSKGWTQEELAKRSGYSRSSIINWETGKRAPKTVDIEKLAGIFGVSTSEFTEKVNSQISESHDSTQYNDYAYWGGIINNASKLANSKNLKGIKIVTPLLEAALKLLSAVQDQGHETDDSDMDNEDTAPTVSVYSGNNSTYRGNSFEVTIPTN